MVKVSASPGRRKADPSHGWSARRGVQHGQSGSSKVPRHGMACPAMTMDVHKTVSTSGTSLFFICNLEDLETIHENNTKQLHTQLNSL